MTRQVARLPAAALIALVAAYQALTVCWRPRCRFLPSCSTFAREALSTLPLLAALGLTLGRLLRCQPFSRGGFDPVPADPSRLLGGGRR